MVKIFDKLFDIVQCSHQIFLCDEMGANCNDPTTCTLMVHIQCTCPKEKNVPQEELQWLRSQRVKVGERAGMPMVVVDKVATKKHEKYIGKKMRKLEAELKRKEKMAAVEIELEERVMDYNMEI